MIRTTDLAHMIVRQSLRAGDWAVDATVGNGNDTRFLADLVGPQGRVFGFDVQSRALEEASAKLEGKPHVFLFQSGHEHLRARLPVTAQGRLSAVMFNLGYLPGSDKDVVTRADTTLAALRQSLELLKIGGIITLVLYPGHPGGAEEVSAVRTYSVGLSQNYAVQHVERPNATEAVPSLLVIEKVRSDHD